KITAHAQTPEAAIARMDRALREFRIRGVSTNIAFVENLLKHPTFLSNEYSTKFIDTTPELFEFAPRRDRGTKVLTYIADVTVNGHADVAGLPRPREDLALPRAPEPKNAKLPDGLKQLLDRDGPQAVADWMAAQKQLLITDTTMRDSHQSLLATRMRSIDMITIAPNYARDLSGLFSVECWGGATFDVAYRFLDECPWQRLRDLRAAMPNLITQMLLRGSNGVGYTNYPDNVVRGFVNQAAASGIDLFRVFDPLNWSKNMRVSMDAVLASGKILEAAICYTGDVQDPNRSKYDLKYYVAMAKELKAAGTHILCLKDMGGLMKPAAARVLFKALKEEVGLPIHFHTHDTAGIASGAILAASEVGVDAVDCAMDALSGNTSQATLGTVVEALRHTERETDLDVGAIRQISNYWESVRNHYAAFESGMQSPASEVYLHEMPGGQFTNLKAQARSLGLEDRWHDVARTYAEVNQMFGDVIKVTPIAKTVGDMALMMVSQGLTCEDVLNPDTEVSFPESVVTLMKGYVGQAHGGFPEAIVNKVLKGEQPITVRPGELLEPEDLKTKRTDLAETLGVEIDDEDLMGALMYPKVFADYAERHKVFGPVRTLPSKTFFYGMQPGDEITAEIDPGKTLEIRMVAVGETREDGNARVFFELNGQPRTIRVADKRVTETVAARAKAEPDNPNHLGAPMPGVVSTVAIKAGQSVKSGDLLMTIEAMKMETGLHADRDAVVKALHIQPGGQIDAKDLLLEFESPE
ncbi:MAG: pyruvate carboxylase, partial [Pseudomonadota bacterium]